MAQRPVLVELIVRDLGVIEELSVVFEDGLTALTGETGAGKTLLVGALGLLLGGKADAGLIRAGANEARVEARFGHLDHEDDDVILTRVVARNGRGRAYLNGNAVAVSALADVAAGLMELHGQHQHRSLVHSDAQRQALDHFGRIDLAPLNETRQEVQRLRSEQALLGGSAVERAREMDLLRYQIAEIDDAGLHDPNEEHELIEEEARLSAAADCRQAARTALGLVAESDAGSALDALARASGHLAAQGPLAVFDQRLRNQMAELGDLATDLRSVVETWEDDPVRLEELGRRRQQLGDLKRKYGDTLAEVVAYGDESRRRAEALGQAGERANALQGLVDVAEERLATEARTVADARRAVAPELAGAIESTLWRLAMPSARFAIAVDGEGAADDVEFQLGANRGEPLQSLARTASGGELARTMLAVRLALNDAPRVMIFDEVDAGLGGEAAKAVGEALADLGARGQVLVVTHLPQVAAVADRHFLVVKAESEGRTTSAVRPLEGEDRVTEISRMLSGEPTSATARRHAAELLGHAGGVVTG